METELYDEDGGKTVFLISGLVWYLEVTVRTIKYDGSEGGRQRESSAGLPIEEPGSSQADINTILTISSQSDPTTPSLSLWQLWRE